MDGGFSARPRQVVGHACGLTGAEWWALRERIVRILARRLPWATTHEVEDAASDVIMALLAGVADAYDPAKGTRPAFFASVARSRGTNLVRKQRGRLVGGDVSIAVDDRTPSPESIVARREVRRVADDAPLEGYERRAWRAYLDGIDGTEIAAELGLDKAQASRALSMAVAWIARGFGQQPPRRDAPPVRATPAAIEDERQQGFGFTTEGMR
jgi:hypothetical protein